MKIDTLRKWLREPGNSRTKIALFLGYKSTAVIDGWIARGEIPVREWAGIERAMTHDIVVIVKPITGAAKKRNVICPVIEESEAGNLVKKKKRGRKPKRSIENDTNTTVTSE